MKSHKEPLKYSKAKLFFSPNEWCRICVKLARKYKMIGEIVNNFLDDVNCSLFVDVTHSNN